MEFKHTLEVLYAQADEIKGIVARLKDSETIRAIELDLLLEKLRNIYDLILDLEATLPSGEKEKSSPAKPAVYPVEKHETMSVIEEVKEDKEPIKEIEPSEKTETDKKKIQPVKESPKKLSQKQEKEFVADRFKGAKHTLHEEMAGRAKQEDISTQYKTKPINNILGAIALNERFELINNLFNGDKAGFEHTMEILNSAGSFVEAYNYLQDNFEWDMDDEYVQRILELIRRKLIVRRDE